MERPYIVKCKKCNREFYSSKSIIKVCDSCKNKKSYGNTSWYRNKKIAMERDDNKCQCCGVDGTARKLDKLICHHIDCNPKNHTITNLITLCIQCHLSLHRKYSNYELRRNNIYKLFAKLANFGEFGKTLIYNPSKKIVKKQFYGKKRKFFMQTK